jgi:hypothetical protein
MSIRTGDVRRLDEGQNDGADGLDLNHSVATVASGEGIEWGIVGEQAAVLASAVISLSAKPLQLR